MTQGALLSNIGAAREAYEGIMGLKILDPERASEIRSSFKSLYRDVARRPEGRFPYPIGRESAHNLGYKLSWLEAVPDEVVERFVGVGNPFSIRMPKPGERVLDAAWTHLSPPRLENPGRSGKLRIAKMVAGAGQSDHKTQRIIFLDCLFSSG